MNKNTESILQQRDHLIIVLGFCPLLVAVNTLQAALVLGVTVLILLMILSLLGSVTRNFWPAELNLVASLLMSACAVTMLHMGLQIRFYDYSQPLALYLQLFAMNCMVLASMEAATRKQTITAAVTEAFLIGVLILVLLIVAGLIRQYGGLLLLKQPFGVFLIPGLGMAFYRVLRERRFAA